jgi:hypothetical protein
MLNQLTNDIITIVSLIFGIAGLYVGIWDLRIDMRDLKQDANALQMKEEDDNADGKGKK